MSAIADLRRVIEARFPNAVPLPERTVPQISTGVEALDRILPSGGLPRGRLSVWVPGIGGTAVLRAACTKAVERGERAAWVDGVGRVSPSAEWGGVTLARPRAEKEALECAEELLRSGGFAVVVRVGEGSRGPERVRLCRAAREGGSALVEISRDPHMAAVRIRARASPESFRWRTNELGERMEVESVTLRVQVAAAGWSRESDVVLVVMNHEHSLSVDPWLADRRGVAR
jgi:recA bacterial DNA recombination protein